MRSVPKIEDVLRVLASERSTKYRDAARMIGFSGDPGRVREVLDKLCSEGIARKVMDGTRNFHYEVEPPAVPVSVPEPIPDDEPTTLEEAEDDRKVWTARRRGKKLGEVAELDLDPPRYQIISPWDPKTYGSLSEAFAGFSEKRLDTEADPV